MEEKWPAGSMDEIFRHSITKMSNFHFVSTEKSKKRVKQLGENPKNIFSCRKFRRRKY